MEGYLEIFGRKFCGKKGNFELWRRKLFFGEWKHWPHGVRQTNLLCFTSNTGLVWLENSKRFGSCLKVHTSDHE
jgi:hypothetical protein